ncbi:MAG TPA: response regulator [Spirochaetes bacterium]|nr:response regulator [Spirochaetota bacterium]
MGKKILIVDDASFIRVLVKDILIPKGYEIAGEAVNGREVVAKYEELKPDLVTMDITMKEKDGLEAARERSNGIKNRCLGARDNQSH